MRTAVRSGGSAALLLVVLAGAWTAGSLSRPEFPGDAPQAPPSPGRSADHTGGYALVPRTTTFDPRRPGELVFTVAGPGGPAGVPRLTVVRLDATALQHPVPVAAPDGTWRAPLTLPAAGPYRVLAEVTPAGGPTRELTADLTAPGPFTPVPFTPSRVAEVDGYQVRLDGDLLPGAEAQVFATVSRDDGPVTDLEPVEGAFGRLEGVREGDLAPVRVHPDAAPPAPTDRAGPGIAFTVEAPAPGTYRLFLAFRHGGVPHTAVLTVPTGSTG